MTLYALDGIAPAVPTGFFWVADSASVMGNVEIGEDVSIWFGAVIRGDNDLIRIGRGTNIQDMSMLHVDPGVPLTIGENCTIGHRAILHGCTVGDGSLIGMGATVLNGAVIGRNCLVGAGALVTEGKTFPDNTLIVGAPARVVRPIDAEGAARLLRSAQSYQQNARRFATGLTPVR